MHVDTCNDNYSCFRASLRSVDASFIFSIASCPLMPAIVTTMRVVHEKDRIPNEKDRIPNASWSEDKVFATRAPRGYTVAVKVCEQWCCSAHNHCLGVVQLSSGTASEVVVFAAGSEFGASSW